MGVGDMGVGDMGVGDMGVGTRWTARPAWARVVRVLVVAVPLAAGIGAAAVASRLVDDPRPGTAPWWLVVFGISTAASTLVAVAARRLLPLAALLRLSLAFPDHTPSRFRVALRAGSVGRLHRQVEHVRTHGVSGATGTAAATVLELATALNLHDARTRGHSERVRALTELIAEEMHLPADDRDRLRWAALLHDCGKLMVHSDVLNKRDHLDDDEWQQIRRHPIEGARLAAPLAGWLGPWAKAIEEHHERYDGFGYPYGRAGHEISLGARIVSVADAFEVMTAARSYQRPVTADAARTELAREAGHQFDPDVVRAFLAVSIGRLRWLVGPISWMAELPVIRTAVQAPGGVAPVTLSAVTVAAASVLGLVAPPAPAADRRPDPVVAAPARPVPTLPLETAGPVVVTEAPPARVLGRTYTAPDDAEPVAVPTPAPVPPTVVADPAPPALDLPTARVADACEEDGVLSAPVDEVVEPVATAVAPPLGTTVDAVNCGVVVPVEGLLVGLLEPTPLAEIVGNSSLLP